MGATLKMSGRAAAGLTVGGIDLVGGEVADTLNETTIATVSIPANTFKSYMIVFADVDMRTTNAADCIARIKVGAAGAETTRDTVQMNLAHTNTITNGNKEKRTIFYCSNSETWTSARSVIITGQNSVASVGDATLCKKLVVVGQ